MDCSCTSYSGTGGLKSVVQLEAVPQAAASADGENNEMMQSMK